MDGQELLNLNSQLHQSSFLPLISELVMPSIIPISTYLSRSQTGKCFVIFQISNNFLTLICALKPNLKNKKTGNQCINPKNISTCV